MKRSREMAVKKIINGKRYDTGAAKLIGTWDNRLSVTDFRHVSEKLYRKITGEYFLYGEGGAMSKYSQSSGERSWMSGFKITPLTRAQALRWAEESFMSADEIEKEFEVLDEGDLIISIGETIRRMRKDQGMTQEDLAARVGTDISIIGRYERADISMSVVRLVEIAKALGVEPAELLQR